MVRINIIKRTASLFSLAGLFALAVVVQPVAAAGSSPYNSVPDPLPSSNLSIGYQATQTAEFGAKVQFAAGERTFENAEVVLNSWACQTGNWNTGDCVTTPGATYEHDVTLNIYAVNTDGTKGAVLKSVTDTFSIPYRPSANPAACAGSTSQWQNTAGTCQNGYNHLVSFNLDNVTLHDQVVYGVEYNTQTWGYQPMNASGPYDSLNVSLVTLADVNTGIHMQTFRASGATPVFQADLVYASYVPAVRFNAAQAQPVTKDDCKKDGWKNFGFKNQGQCVSSVASNKNN